LRIHQIGSVLAAGDAVTNQIVEIDRRLARWGFTSCIYGSDISAAPVAKAQLDAAYLPFVDATEDVLLYHYSAYCENHVLFRRSRNRKVLIYHNITPAEYFRPYDSYYESLCSQGRRLVGELKECDFAVGVSEYNRLELVEQGFVAERSGILPLFLGVEDFDRSKHDEALLRQLRAGSTVNILFVGRVAPNKAFEDLVKIFYSYHRYVNPNSRLILAGACFLPSYDRTLKELLTRLTLTDAVIFTNRIPLHQLKTYYLSADLFLCASRHEGFCAPLLEAMYFGIPILAYAAAAVPYTLGSAGVQFNALEYDALAELMELLMENQTVRQRILATQKARLGEFAPNRVEEQLGVVLNVVGVDVSVPAHSQGKDN
jgi:L-malate glycosyltransferase